MLKDTFNRLFFLLFLLGLFNVKLLAQTSPQTSSGSILFTNDLHSHFDGLGPDAVVSRQDHYARLLTLIGQTRQENKKNGRWNLLVDSGDFYGGTLFQNLIFHPQFKKSAEVDFFETAGYDAWTLGNHEFDQGGKNLVKILGANVPAGLVLSNLLQSAASGAQWASNIPTQKIVQVPTQNAGIFLKIGLLGVIGPDALRVSAHHRGDWHFVGFNDQKAKKEMTPLIELLQKQMEQLRVRDQVQMVVVLLHGAGDEEAEIAKKVKGIDLIVAGHSHEAYAQPKKIGTTWVVQSGASGRNLGHIDFTYHGDSQKFTFERYFLKPITETIIKDRNYQQKIARYRRQVDEMQLFKKYQYATPIYTLTRDYLKKAELHNEFGVWVASKLRSAWNGAHHDQPIDIYFTSLSLIRENWLRYQGKPTLLQFSDIFRLLPMGETIMVFEWSPQQLKNALTFMELYRFISPLFTSIFSDSLKFVDHAWGIPGLNRITDVTIEGKALNEITKPIRLASSKYVVDYLGKVSDLSYGLIDLSPRNVHTFDHENEALLLADALALNL